MVCLPDTLKARAPKLLPVHFFILEKQENNTGDIFLHIHSVERQYYITLTTIN